MSRTGILRGEMPAKRRKRWGEHRIVRSIGEDADKAARWILAAIACLVCALISLPYWMKPAAGILQALRQAWHWLIGN